MKGAGGTRLAGEYSVLPAGSHHRWNPYYHVQGRQGSVRELVTASGTVATQYYDPYGNLARLSGTVGSDIGYAGCFYHAASGLELTLNRVYDPVHARWLSRDPIREIEGFAYAAF